MFGFGRKKSNPLNAEYHTLSRDQKAKVDAVAADAKRNRASSSTNAGGNEYYAYPHANGGTAWGINSGATGANIKRGVKP